MELGLRERKGTSRRLRLAPADAGNTWTWTAIDADTKLIVSYFVGGRATANAPCGSWTIWPSGLPIASS